MKKFALLLVMLVSISSYSQQGKPPKGERPDGPSNGEQPKKERISVDDQVKQMTKDLNLNEVQQLKVRELLLYQEKKRGNFSANKQKEKPNREEMEAKMTEERKVFNAKLKNILSEEQFAKLNSSKEKKEKKKEKKKLKKEE
jgi:protein CpxP